MSLWFGKKSSVLQGTGLIDEEVFMQLLKKPLPKLIITRRHNLQVSPGSKLIYLSKVPHNNHVDPTKLYFLEKIVWDELQKARHDVILDAFEYLTLENGLETALKFTGKLRDMAVLSGSNFYVTVSNALDERTIHMLRRILD